MNGAEAARRYRKNPLTAGRVIEGLAFVVTPEDNKLHSLNSTATRLWSMAAEAVTADEVAAALASEFEIDLATARQDAQECLDDLVARQILVAI